MFLKKYLAIKAVIKTITKLEGARTLDNIFRKYILLTTELLASILKIHKLCKID